MSGRLLDHFCYDYAAGMVRTWPIWIWLGFWISFWLAL